MEAREAVYILERMYKGTPTTAQIEALEKAYSALDKQIPKEPELINMMSSCPECGCHVKRCYAYCRECGQALDW